MGIKNVKLMRSVVPKLMHVNIKNRNKTKKIRMNLRREALIWKEKKGPTA